MRSARGRPGLLIGRIVRRRSVYVMRSVMRLTIVLKILIADLASLAALRMSRSQDIEE